MQGEKFPISHPYSFPPPSLEITLAAMSFTHLSLALPNAIFAAVIGAKITEEGREAVVAQPGSLLSNLVEQEEIHDYMN